ncbi:uncharacterized protein LOC111120524 isoform X1 [Crassostrea virginica]
MKCLWSLLVCCMLCYLSEARPHEKKHGTLYSDPGYIGYWRPPAVNKIFYPEKETKSSETKGEKSVHLNAVDNLNSGKVEDETVKKTAESVKEKTVSTALPSKHSTTLQHKTSTTEAPRHQAPTRQNIALKPPHQVSRGNEENSQKTDKKKSKITSVNLIITDEGTPSKWNHQMKEFIKEVYGGELPYSENVMLSDDSGKPESLTTNTGTEHHLSQPVINQSPADSNDRIPEKAAHKLSKPLTINEESETKESDDSMVKVIKKIHEHKDTASESETVSQGNHEPATKSETEHHTTPTGTGNQKKPRESEHVTKPNKTENHDHHKATTKAETVPHKNHKSTTESPPKPSQSHQNQERSRVKGSSTTAAPSTRPNPPTTRPSRVTPVTKRKIQPKESKHPQPKSHASCRSDRDCRSGRMCHEGACVCGDDTLCARHTHPVCGSDGVVYPSHCELHRQACTQHRHIKVDVEGKGCTSHSRTTPAVQQAVRNNTVIRGVRCEYRIHEKTEGVLWGKPVVTTEVISQDSCLDQCEQLDSCVGFEFSSDNSLCAVFERGPDLSFWPNPKMTFYEVARCKHKKGDRCSFEQIKVNSDNVYLMCDVSVHFMSDIVECQAACKDCAAFTFLQGVCQVYHNERCVNMLNDLGKNHYIKHCHNTVDTNSSCHILEVTPGRSPYMCSKATSTLSTLLDCHDTCLRGHCEAFKFLNNGFCEIYFDKSCLEMLKKGRENYYVRRCANPKDCSYHEVQLPANVPCEIRSDKMSSFEDCRDTCDDCTAIKYDYSTGECHIYHHDSCITQKSVNYIKRDCGITQELASTTEPLLLRFKRPDNKVAPVHPLRLAEGDQSGVVLPSEAPEDHAQGEPEIRVSLEVKKPGPRGNDNGLGDSQLKDRVEEAMFSELCTVQEYGQMKADILRYHCVRFQERDCSPRALYNKKGYLASLMFSYYDKNMDNKIIRDELWEIWVTEPFQRMFASCSLMDMFRFENILDDEIQEEEFLKAFDLEPTAFLEEFQEVPTLATVGNGLELRCGISPSSENSHIIWSRHRADLETISFPGIAVFSDGTLFFENVGVHHIGNWSCYDQYRSGFQQVHTLQVNIPPIVKVSPSSMMLPVNGVDIYLHCHVIGIPQPKIQWQFNNKVIPVSPDHYARIHDNGTLIIKNSNYQRDSGAYKCYASNVAGNSEDIAMLYIQKPNQTENLYGKKTARQETFFVFHETGYSAYNPSGCYTKRKVHSSFGHLKYIPEELDGPIFLCDQKQGCTWGQSVNVRNKLLYVAQPKEGRVVVIDSAETMNPVEFINTDQYPTKLYYVEHLDEVWVLCWNSDRNMGSKTIVVIKEASSDIRHRMVHTQPVGYKFDLVQDMFLPPHNDLPHPLRYGYVIHSEQRTLFKIELDSMRYTKSVDLVRFGCVPQDVAFIHLGGHILVKCQEGENPGGQATTQILMDLITDTPVANSTLSGTPYVSPDSRNVVNVDKETGKVSIAKVTDKGEITKMTDVTVSSKVSDVTFFPSKDGHGYDIVMTSQELPEIYYVQLSNGKITTLKGMGEPAKMTLNPFTPVSRAVVSGDVFSKYLATPSENALLILNGQDMYPDCQLTGLKNPDKVAYNVASIV